MERPPCFYGKAFMMKVQTVIDWLDAYAPFQFAASWDNSGLQVGDPEAPVDRLLVALDITQATLEEAHRLGCQCLVAHHPLIFQPVTSVRTDAYPGKLIHRAVRDGIHLVAAHTNLDAAIEGTNRVLAETLALSITGPMEREPRWDGHERYGGMGCIGSLDPAERFSEFVDRLRAVLTPARLRAVGDPERIVRRVAVCSGSGGSLLQAALAAACDVFVTGDLKYHEARYAQEEGLSLVDVGHFASERLMVAPLADHLESRAQRERVALKVYRAERERDPFWYPEPNV